MKTDQISNTELRALLTERCGPDIAGGMDLAEVRRAFAAAAPKDEQLRPPSVGRTRQHPRWDNG